MKAAFTLLSIYAALAAVATPTAASTHATTHDVPTINKIVDVNDSLDADAPSPEAAAAATQYWVCIAVSPSTRAYGWAQGGSESAALSEAEILCGYTDCGNYACQETGCVGLDFGYSTFTVSTAVGYGTNDGPEAASVALAGCEAHDIGCGTPGYACAQYIE